jgi:hypothetical protein
MPANEDAEWRKLVIGFPLFFFAAFMIVALFIVPRDLCEFSGFSMVAFGAIFAVLSRATGRWRFKLGSAFPFDSVFWKRLGLKGAQRLDLGFGLVLMGAGCLFLLKFYLWRLVP